MQLHMAQKILLVEFCIVFVIVRSKTGLSWRLHFLFFSCFNSPITRDYFIYFVQYHKFWINGSMIKKKLWMFQVYILNRYWDIVVHTNSKNLRKNLLTVAQRATFIKILSSIVFDISSKNYTYIFINIYILYYDKFKQINDDQTEIPLKMRNGMTLILANTTITILNYRIVFKCNSTLLQ